MTVERARELLSNEVKNLSDNDVQKLIDRDYQLCDALLDVIVNSHDNLLTLNEKSN